MVENGGGVGPKHQNHSGQRETALQIVYYLRNLAKLLTPMTLTKNLLDTMQFVS